MGTTAAHPDVIRSVETFAAGDYPGDKPGEVWSYTPDDVRTIARNFAALSEGDNPLHTVEVTLTHDGVQTHGKVAAARADGDLLLTDWQDVSVPLRAMVKAKRVRKVSAEIKRDFTDREGNVTPGPYLYRVAVLGADPPRVKGLHDIPAKFADAKRGRRIDRVFRFADAERYCGGEGSGVPGPCPEGGDKGGGKGATGHPAIDKPLAAAKTAPDKVKAVFDASPHYAALATAGEANGVALATAHLQDALKDASGAEVKAAYQAMGYDPKLVKGGVAGVKAAIVTKTTQRIGSAMRAGEWKGTAMAVRDARAELKEHGYQPKSGKFADKGTPMDFQAALAFLAGKGIDVSAYGDTTPQEMQTFIVGIATAWQQEDATEDTADTGDGTGDGTGNMADGKGNPKKVTVTQQFADRANATLQRTMLAFQAKLDAGLKRINDAEAAAVKARQGRESEERVGQVRLFCDRMTKELRMDPADNDEAVPQSLRSQMVLLARQAVQPAQKFADAKGVTVEKTSLQLMQERVEAQPVRKFSERLPQGQQQKPDDPFEKRLAAKTAAEAERAKAIAGRN